MVRVVDEDYKTLCAFFEAYSLEHVIGSDEFKKSVKEGHKTYLSLLYLWAQCLHMAKNGSLSPCGKAMEESELVHLKECVSDIGSGFFCCFHGVYKPGHMALRSSIENFLRFIAAPFDVRAGTTTSVFELFDIAGSTPPFSGARAAYIRDLRGAYNELCKFTHSASMTHMVGIHALSHYPAFDAAAFMEWTKFVKLVGQAIARTLVFSDPDIFLKCHFKNQEVMELLIPVKERRLLFETKGRGSYEMPRP